MTILEPVLTPESGEIHVNLLCACQIKLEDFSGCVDTLRKIDKAVGLTHTQLRLLATSLTQLSLCDEAGLVFSRIPNISENPRASQDCALNLVRMGQPEKARELLQAALSSVPNDSRLMLQEGLLGLKFGIDDVSRKNYYQRHFVNNTSPLPSKLAPLWWDSELSGKHVLLWGEQGIGDELIFFLVLEILAQANVTCSIACEKRLIRLLSHNFPGLKFVIDRNDPRSVAELSEASNFDIQARVGDLWQLVEINSTALPKDPLLTAPDDLVNIHRSAFPNSGSGTTIGIAWYSKEQRNHIPDFFLDRIYAEIPANWLNLQHSITDNFDLGNSLIHQKAERQLRFTANDDFSSYAVSILSTDLVITNDTTAGVLSSMLGKTTMVLCPHDPFWFWDASQRLDVCRNTTVLTRKWNQSWEDFFEEKFLPSFQQNASAFSPGRGPEAC